MNKIQQSILWELIAAPVEKMPLVFIKNIVSDDFIWPSKCLWRYSKACSLAFKSDIWEDMDWLLKPSIYEPNMNHHNHFIPTKNAFKALFTKKNQKKQNLALMKVGAETMALVAGYNKNTFEFYLYDSHGKNAIAQEHKGHAAAFVKKFEIVADLSKFVYGNKGENQANDQIQNKQLNPRCFLLPFIKKEFSLKKLFFRDLGIF